MSGISSALFISFLTAIFAPLEFYITNKSYFFFSGTELIPFAVLLFVTILICGITTTLILSVLPGYLPASILITGTGIFFSLYIIGNYMVTDYGAMDGREVDWSAYPVSCITQVAVMISIPLISLLLSLLLKGKDIILKIYGYISLAITGILITTLTAILITTGLTKDPEYLVTTEDEFTLSGSKNVIVLVLDTYDSAVFRNILDSDHDKYAEELKDFTYYPDTLSMYAATDLAIPQIITGMEYYNERTYGEYLTDAYRNSPLLSYLLENDYSVGIYTICRMPQSDISDNICNLRYMRRTVSSHRHLAKYMYRFLGFRYMPQPLKQYFWFYPDEMRVDIESSGDDSIHIFQDNNYIFDGGIQDITADIDAPVFRLYHLDGVHPPFSMGSDFSMTGTTTSIEDEGRGIMVPVGHLTDKLKSLGIYDDTAIVIMADHGYNDLRSNPLFMIKGFGENHEFTISDRPLSYEYIQDILLSICNGKSAAEASEHDMSISKERKYLCYSWDKDLSDYSYADKITEYSVPGKAWETDDFIEVGEYSAPE